MQIPKNNAHHEKVLKIYDELMMTKEIIECGISLSALVAARNLGPALIQEQVDRKLWDVEFDQIQDVEFEGSAKTDTCLDSNQITKEAAAWMVWSGNKFAKVHLRQAIQQINACIQLEGILWT